MRKANTKCEACNSKGYYTQIFGIDYAADFYGDKAFSINPRIHLIACPRCNFRNKRKLKDVQSNVFN